MTDTVEVNDHLAELESELERLGKSVDTICAAQEAPSKAVSTSKSVLAILEQVSRGYQELHESDKKLKDEIHDVIDKISRVDFPSRLDKLDNTVSAVSIGVQNLIHDVSQEFEGVEDRLVPLHHALVVQRRISFTVAALVIGGLIASFLLR